MSLFVANIFNSIIFVIYCYFGSRIILHQKHSETKKMILAVILLFIMYYIAICLLDTIYVIFFSSVSAFLFIKITFKESSFMSLSILLILNTVKMLIKMLVLAFLNNDHFLLHNTYKILDLSAFYTNVISIILSIILILLFRKILWKLIKYISGLKNRRMVLLIAAYANFLLISISQPLCDLLTMQAITDIMVIIGVTSIGIFGLSSEMKMESLNKHYQEIYEYSKSNAELLHEYKMQVHENKNRLLMIKSMLDGPSKDISKYIDTILKEISDNRNSMNYWLTELQYIPLAGVRNFINYKLIKLKNLGAKIEVFVSNELEVIDPSFLNNKEYNELTTILGVILDNMIESIKETEEKLVSIHIYLEDNKVHGEFVNTFSGKIDLNRLNEIGYTTKGEQHGVGLPLVAKIVKMNKRFECNPKIIDNFFTQHLTIKIYNKNNLQKTTQN